MSNFGHSIQRLLFWTELKRIENTEERREFKLPWCSHNQLIIKCSHEVQFKYPFHTIAQIQLEDVDLKFFKKLKRTDIQSAKNYQNITLGFSESFYRQKPEF